MGSKACMKTPVEFEVTRGFDADLKSIAAGARVRVSAAIDAVAIDPNAHGDRLELIDISLPEGYESSLATLDVGEGLRVILGIEDDPLFERTLVTLFRLVSIDRLRDATSGIESAIRSGLPAAHPSKENSNGRDQGVA